MRRERLGSRLSFILLSAGCAIGIGNVWKFPYIAGEYGGGIFVIIYLLFLLLIGVPAMTMEFAVGRAAQKSPAKIYNELEKPGQKWHWHSYIAVLGNYLLMMFYTVVAGWMLQYCVSTMTGKFSGLSPEQIENKFNEMLENPVTMIIYTFIVIIIGFSVCSGGVQKCLERITKWMMLALLAIMIILSINSIFLAGGREGLAFYLIPDIAKMKNAGILAVIVAAMNQAFFTLSIGIGSMAIFGSYLGKERSLLGESVNIAFLDTFVAISSGLIIFPACYAYNIPVSSGPPLIFVTLPNVFNNLPGGQFWGTLFFIFMFFAALSTVFAVFENIISCTIDLTNWSRKKACFINCVAMFVLCLPCIFGFNLLNGIQPFGEGSVILDLEDFIVSNLLPAGALIFILFCVTKYGWGWKNFVSEANQGKGLKIANWMRIYMTYILPIIILGLLIIGILTKFNLITL